MAERYLQALQSMKKDGTYQLLLKLPQQPEQQKLPQPAQSPGQEPVAAGG